MLRSNHASVRAARLQKRRAGGGAGHRGAGSLRGGRPQSGGDVLRWSRGGSEEDLRGARLESGAFGTEENTRNIQFGNLYIQKAMLPIAAVTVK